MLVDELVMWARLEDLRRETSGRYGVGITVGRGLPSHHARLSHPRRIDERPHAEARRILGRWLVGRRLQRACQGATLSVKE